MRQVNDIYWDTLSLVYLYYSWFPELVTMSNPEEWGYLPFGHLQPAGEGANASLLQSLRKSSDPRLRPHNGLSPAPGTYPEREGLFSCLSGLVSQEKQVNL